MKKLFFLLLGLALLVSVLPVQSLQAAPLSPALHILAGDVNVTVTAVAAFEEAPASVGGEGPTASGSITFSPDDFENALGIKKLSAIVIASLPPVTEGRLYLGALAVARGQVISRAAIDDLRFEPTAAALATLSEQVQAVDSSGTVGSTHITSSFTFALPDTDYAVRCQLYLLAAENEAPSAALSPASATNLVTYQNIAAGSDFAAVDPEGDELSHSVIKSPKHGTVVLTSTGYVYRPDRDYKGSDSFVYAATDLYGNRSEDIKVTVRVLADAGSFDDMAEHPSHAAAIRAASAGIMTFESGSTPATLGQRYFNPDGSLSRSEFLVAAMKALNMAPVSHVLDTGFEDDSAVSAAGKGYVAAAAELGIIRGVETDQGRYFYPAAAITRAEAATMIASMLALKAPVETVSPVFLDPALPSWAAEAMATARTVGALDAGAATDILTRAEAADAICALMDHISR